MDKVVDFCDGFHLLQREASLTRSGHYIYLWVWGKFKTQLGIVLVS